MKRYKKISLFIEDLGQNICDVCKRWRGDFTEDDKYVCKYNTDGKGLYSGLCINHPECYKCKYFKRNEKYMTSRFMSKNYISMYKQDGVKITKRVKWVRGKFKTITLKGE